MAIIRNGILGKFTGSVGNITGYNLAGQQVVKEKTIKVANPNTMAQQAVRANFIYAVEIYKILKPLLIYTLRERDKKQTVLSEFLRLNLNTAIVNRTVDLDKLIIAKPNSPSTELSLDMETGINNLASVTVL